MGGPDWVAFFQIYLRIQENRSLLYIGSAYDTVKVCHMQTEVVPSHSKALGRLQSPIHLYSSTSLFPSQGDLLTHLLVTYR